jgi:hypothetical protein
MYRTLSLYKIPREKEFSRRVRAEAENTVERRAYNVRRNVTFRMQ